MIAALHVAAAGVSLWPQPSKVVINDPTLVTFTGNFAFVSGGEKSDELQNAIHRYTDLLSRVSAKVWVTHEGVNVNASATTFAPTAWRHRGNLLPSPLDAPVTMAT